MSQIPIYIDEDAMDSDLVAALRSHGVIVITALDAGLVGKSDDEQLTFATDHACVLYTFNVSDFYRLHTECVGAGREHAGMILSKQQRLANRIVQKPHAYRRRYCQTSATSGCAALSVIQPATPLPNTSTPSAPSNHGPAPVSPSRYAHPA